MTFFFKTLIGAAAFVAVSHASASSLFDEGLPDAHGLGADIAATAQFDFSPRFLSALNASGASVYSESPGKLKGLINRGGIRVASASMPVDELGLSEAGTFNRITSLSTSGGWRILSEDDGFVTHGGLLSITNLTVDTGLGVIHADLSGANGVATQRLQLFTYASQQGALDVDTRGGQWQTALSFTGLQLSAPAFTYFSQALGLTPDPGDVVLNTVRDFGTLTFSISAVPEPSRVALTVVGLTMMGMAVRRRARRRD